LAPFVLILRLSIPGRAGGRGLDPVGIAFEGDDFVVVDKPVDHRGSYDVVAEHVTPAAERLVGGDDQAGPLAAAGDQLEKQVGHAETVVGVDDARKLTQCRQDSPVEPGLSGSS
jgi:hypothetical protein